VKKVIITTKNIIMKKRLIRLTESDLMRLVKRVIKEREKKSLLDRYMDMMDEIVSEYSSEDYYENMNMLEDLDSLVNSAEKNQDLSDKDIDEIYYYYDEITRGLDFSS